MYTRVWKFVDLIASAGYSFKIWKLCVIRLLSLFRAIFVQQETTFDTRSIKLLKMAHMGTKTKHRRYSSASLTCMKRTGCPLKALPTAILWPLWDFFPTSST